MKSYTRIFEACDRVTKDGRPAKVIGIQTNGRDDCYNLVIEYDDESYENVYDFEIEPLEEV